MRDDLFISQGALSNDDGSWDIEFWQKVSFEERVNTAYQMALFADSLGSSRDLETPPHIDRFKISSGKLPPFE